jgi:hypothetical protein
VYHLKLPSNENAALSNVNDEVTEEMKALGSTELGYTVYPITGPPDDLLVPKFVK